ncbi:hypothetical protein RvY_03401 [Ramazzottius varieornatus]|uniref:Lysosomal dipeptide transporter MFSD1 n=1 Tax=Ramazzottius varieornatus TaxID=947166 RepID=A0A1D1UMX1_RAMVA|nr:hypothetical protein RvY_03401 [Ramazzottius varieornatus]
MDTRWWILFWVCAISFFSEFFISESSILVQRLTGTAEECRNGEDACLDIDILQFNVVISMYSWAAAAASLLAGAISDRYGTKFALLVTASFYLIGPIIFTLGAYVKSRGASLGLLVLGRIILGLAAGSYGVLGHRIKAGWFFYKELGISFSLHIMFDRIGDASAYLILGALLPYIGMRGVMWFSVGMVIIASASAVILSYLDNKSGALGVVWTSTATGQPSSLWLAIKSFDHLFWAITLIIFFYYGTVSTFTANGPNYISQAYAFSESASSYVVGLVYDMGLLAPLAGYLMDRFGHREYWFLGCAAILFLAFLFELTIPQFPAALLTVMVGLGYTGFGPLAWSTVPVVVSSDTVGLGLGFGKFAHNAGVATMTTITGALLETEAEKVPWINLFIFLFVTTLICLLLAALIVWLNWLTFFRLTFSQRQRSQHNTLQEITPLRVAFEGRQEQLAAARLASTASSTKSPLFKTESRVPSSASFQTANSAERLSRSRTNTDASFKSAVSGEFIEING